MAPATKPVVLAIVAPTVRYLVGLQDEYDLDDFDDRAAQPTRKYPASAAMVELTGCRADSYPCLNNLSLNYIDCQTQAQALYSN